MSKENKNSSNLMFLVLKTAVIQIVLSAIFVSIFALIMYFADLDNKLSPIFGTLSVGFASMISAFLTSKKIGKKGYLTGFYVGIITFAVILLASFVVDKGSVTINTLFHFIIIVLSSLIGGIMGVNKKEKKYI